MIQAFVFWAALGATEPSPKPDAQPAFTLSVDGGANFFNNGNGVGGGFNVYPGLELGTGLVVPELQVGMHAVTQTLVSFAGGGITSRLYIVPIYVGARYEMSRLFALGPVKPFVGLHLGAAVVSGKNAYGTSTDSARFGFNIGLGVDYAVCRAFGIGASLWYDIVNGDNDSDNAWLSLGLNARYHFAFDTTPESP